MANIRHTTFASLLALSLGASGAAWAGPVILGGDDLTDHGSRTAGPPATNNEGWLYIQKAVEGIVGGETRAGTHDVTIAALGSAANPTFSSGNAGGAIGSAADILGFTVAYYDGDTAINDFFAALGAGTTNPQMLWIAGTGAANDLDSSEGTALTSNALAIAAFVNSGGGLMAHGSGSTAYGWLSTLLPGLTETSGCSSTGATLTAAGAAAFPGLSNSDIDANAGPCHSHFEGSFGTLQVLANDGLDRPYIIGGGTGTIISTEVPEPASLALFGIGLAGLAAAARRRKSA